MGLTETLAYVLKVDSASGVVGFNQASAGAQRLAEAQAQAALAAAKKEQAMARAAKVDAQAANDARALAAANERLKTANQGVAQAGAALANVRADINLARTEQSVRNLDTVGGKLFSTLGQVVPQLGALGTTGAAAAAGPAALGIAAAAAADKVKNFIEAGVNQFAQLAEEVDRYQDLAGGTTEQASKMVVTFRDLNIETETGAKSMGFLGREVAGGGANLEKYGIQIAKNRDGSADLNGTLLNVVDAYNATGDAAVKDAILMAAFGRQGQQLTDVMEQGRAGLERFWKQAENHGEVLTDRDKEAGIQFTRSMKDLNEAFKGLEISAGKWLVPLLTGLARGSTELVDFGTHINAVRKVLESAIPNSGWIGWIADRLGAGSSAAAGASTAMGGLSTSLQGLTTSTLGAATAAQDHAQALDEETNAALGLVHSDEGVAKAQKGVADAQKGVADAQRQGQQHARDLASANRALADASQSVTDAEEKLAEARRKAPLELAKARLAEREATTGVAEATNDLAIAVARYGEQSLQAREARDKLDEANQRVTESHQAVDEAARQKDVADAQKGVADAKQRAADAQQRLNDVLAQDPSQAVTDATNRLHDAQTALRDTLISQQSAREKFNKDLADGKIPVSNLRDSLQGIIDMLKAAGADPSVYAGLQNIINLLNAGQGKLSATPITGGVSAGAGIGGSGSTGPAPTTTVNPSTGAVTVNHVTVTALDPVQAANQFNQELTWQSGVRGVA